MGVGWGGTAPGFELVRSWPLEEVPSTVVDASCSSVGCRRRGALLSNSEPMTNVRLVTVSRNSWLIALQRRASNGASRY